MTSSNMIRHNAKIILPMVRGKSVLQRRELYARLALGPIGIPLMMIANLLTAPRGREE